MYRVDPQDEAKIEALAKLTQEQRERLDTLVRNREIHLPSVLAGLRVAHSLVVSTDLGAYSGAVSVACLLVDNAATVIERKLRSSRVRPAPSLLVSPPEPPETLPPTESAS